MAPVGLLYLSSKAQKVDVYFKYTPIARGGAAPITAKVAAQSDWTCPQLLEAAAGALELLPRKVRRLRGAFRKRDLIGGTLSTFNVVPNATVALSLGKRTAFGEQDVGKEVEVDEYGELHIEGVPVSRRHSREHAPWHP